MANVITEGRRTAEFLVSEANGHRSREQVTLLSGQNGKAGHVLGKTLTGGAAVATANAGNTGNGAMGAITVTGRAKIGTYRLTVIEPGANVGTFRVEDPDGVEIGTGVVATLFNKGGLSFTLADGATDFVAGDGFAIAVTGTPKYKEWNPANSDGSEIACAILYANVDASLADERAVAIVREAEANGNVLTYFSGALTADKAAAKTQLAAVGIIVRS